ncbi:MAG: ABC transporter permease [Rhodospirillaceae bacterium]|nr:ABC transporter permease [Rhodospirillaceae bacterium]
MTRFLLRNAVWIVLLFTTIAFVAVEPRLLSVRIFINVLEHSSILGILVIGMIFCLLAGRFDLSSESTLGFTALVGAWMVSTNPFFGSGWQLPPALVIVLMLGMGAGVGCLNSFFIIKLRVNAFIVTLAMLLALRGFTYVFTNANTMYDLPPSFAALGGYSIGGLLPVSVILFLGLFVLSQFVLSYTAFGRDLYAIGGNREAAFAAGIRVDRRTLTAFVLSGMLGALAAWVLAGRLQAVTINLGQGMVFEVFAAAVIGGVSLAGGKGTMMGPLGGVLLLGVITTGLSVMPISSFWVDAVRGVLILAAVVLWRVSEIFEERWRTGTA